MPEYVLLEYKNICWVGQVSIGANSIPKETFFYRHELLFACLKEKTQTGNGSAYEWRQKNFPSSNYKFYLQSILN
ncbi:MAG: hypothetical protein NUV67_05860, partial [archaeon]|nr:hypothetical protein [archaeon]